MRLRNQQLQTELKFHSYETEYNSLYLGKEINSVCLSFYFLQA